MSFKWVLTLVGTLPHSGLERKTIQEVIAFLESHGLHDMTSQTLSPHEAADLFFTAPLDAAETLLPSIEGMLAAAQIDAVLQPLTTERRKKLLIADMDSTMIHEECLDELAAAMGLKAEIAAITEAAMRGELDFQEALRARVAKLAELPLSALEQTLGRLTLMEGAKTLVATMKAQGAACYLVSGGFRFFTSAIAAKIGFDGDQGNQFDVKDGRLTGHVVEPILDKKSKKEALEDYCNRHTLNLSESLAVGDGANDLPMLQRAGLGIAYHAKPRVAAEARARIFHGNLKALLYVQGFQSHEIIECG